MTDKFDTKAIGPKQGIHDTVRIRYRDMGDGTHAEVLDVSIDASGASLNVDQGVAGDAAPALATNARGVIGWLRKIVDTLGTVLKVSTPIPASLKVVRQAATASAVALPANALQNGGIMKALVDNTGTVYVGGAGVTLATGYPLTAGEAVAVAVSDTSIIYIIGTGTISFIGN